jgi:hypothetical protein
MRSTGFPFFANQWLFQPLILQRRRAASSLAINAAEEFGEPLRNHTRLLLG